MKKAAIFLAGWIPFILSAQNGVTTVAMPSGYTTTDLRQKTVISIDNADNKWLGFKTIGLGKYDGNGWTMYDTNNSSLPSNYVTDIDFQNTDVWTGTRAGAAKLSGSIWSVYTRSNSGLLNDTVNALRILGNDVWFACKDGVCKFDGSNWTSYTSSNSALPAGNVYDINVDQNGTMWAATANGLCVMYNSGFVNFTSQNSVLDTSNIQQLFVDPTGAIYLQTVTLEKYICDGTNLYDLKTLYPANEFIINGYNASRINAGPHGNAACWRNGLNEIRNNFIETYFPTQAPAFPMSCYSTTSSTLWYSGTVSPTFIDLYNFDVSQYNGFGAGPNGSNNTNRSIRTLNVNEVETAVMNRGDQNFNLSTGHYFVPKSSPYRAGTIFTSAIWMGGLDPGNNLHLASMTYRQTGIDYFPGPLDTTNGSTDSTVADQYNRIWKINKLDIQEFQYYWSTGDVQNGNYVPNDDFLSWPAHGTGNQMHNLAPYVDVNTNGTYDPLTGGDYPVIKGDQMLYWIFNDNLGVHTESVGTPLKAEVHASAYAFYCDQVADSNQVLNYTTYYEFQIYNWSGQTYHDSYVGLFQDIDLGDAFDDFVGCYPSANVAFGYNGDQDDGSMQQPTIGTYGAHPPFTSVVILDGPVANAGDGIDNNNNGTTDEPNEHNLLTNFMYYDNDFTTTGNPENASDFYGYLKSEWKDSTHATYGGNGYGGMNPTNHMFPDLPYKTTGYWNETTTGNVPADRRFVTGSGPFDLQNGVPVVYSFAIMYTRDSTAGSHDSLQTQAMLDGAEKISNWHQTHTEPSCVNWVIGVNSPVREMNGLSLYPNPTSSLLTIEFQSKEQTATYDILDLTGRTVMTGTISQTGQTVINAENLPAGIYLVMVNENGQSAAMKFIKQ
jgi:Secretion system C-terminal sorting domain